MIIQHGAMEMLLSDYLDAKFEIDKKALQDRIEKLAKLRRMVGETIITLAFNKKCRYLKC